jgi:RNA polymerase sigma-70 factor (ECF subfamily)
MTDKNLIDSAKGGDKQALERLIEKYASMVFNLSLKLLCNYDDASDCAQETLVKIYTGINKFHEKSSFSTWIYRVTYNTCMDLLRKKKQTVACEIDQSIEDFRPTPYASAEKNERMRKIFSAIKGLSEEYRAAVVLRDINGNSYDEIAEILGCSIGTVKSRINRGRLKLRELLSEYMEQNDANTRQRSEKGGSVL